MATTQRSVRIDDETWERFDLRCAELQTDKSKRIVELIELDVAHEIDSEGSKTA